MTALALSLALGSAGMLAILSLFSSILRMQERFAHLSGAVAVHKNGGPWVGFRVVTKDCSPFVTNAKILPKAKIIHFPIRGADSDTERQNAA